MNFLFWNSRFIDWISRILFSLDLILAGVNNESHSYPINYPLDVLLIQFLAFWLYVYRIRLFSIVLLIIALFINLQHIAAGK